MHRLRMMQLLVLLTIPSVLMSLPLTEVPTSIEESVIQESLIEMKSEQHSNADESRRLCLEEFGSKRFCECVFNEKITFLDLQTYLQVVHHPIDGSGYSSSTKENRQIYNNVNVILDKCTLELQYH
jgi:hypothetical protein